MSLIPLSKTDDWSLSFDDQDVRGYEAVSADGRPTGRRVTDLILDTDAERVASLVFDDGTEYPADDASIGDGVVYLTRTPTHLTGPPSPYRHRVERRVP